MEKKRDTLSSSLRYGLGIGHKDGIPDVPADLELPVYGHEMGESAAETPLFSVGESNILSEVFSRDDLPSGMDQRFADAALRAPGGLYVVVGGREGDVTVIRSRADRPAADIVVIVVKRRSVVTIVEEHAGDAFFARNLFLVAEEGSRANYIAAPTGRGSRHMLRTLFLHSDAEVTFAETVTDLSFHRTILDTRLVGDHAAIHAYSFFRTGGDAVADSLVRVHHVAPETLSRIHALGFADERSRIIARAETTIAGRMRAVDASEEGRFLLLSETAHVDAIPAIDIASRDVVAAHKLAISPISARELFYPESRGLSPSDARSFLLDGLIASELACIKSETLRAIIESRL